MPEHWKVKRLKELSPKITVGVVVNPSSNFSDVGVPMLLGNNLRPGRISTSGVRRISVESNRRLAKSQLRSGNVVVVRVGAPGVAAVVPPELDGCNCASVMIVRQGQAALPLWIEYLSNSPVIGRQIDVVKYGAAEKQFNIAHAVEFLAVVPPVEEQRQVLHHLSRSLLQADTAIDTAERGGVLLREYRTRLIADVVTGKLDVREAAARLPDEVEDAEPIDEAEAGEDAEVSDAGDGEEVPEEIEG